MDINNIQSLITLGYQSFQKQLYDEAIKVWQPIVDFVKNQKVENLDKVYLDLGKCYYRTQQYVQAKPVIMQGLQQYPQDVNLLKLQGFNDEKLGDLDNALQAWQQVLQQYPNHQEATQHIVDINKKLKQQEKQKQASLDVQAFLQKIDEKLAQGLLKDAELDIEQSLQYYPNNHDLLLKYAQISQDLPTKLQRFLTAIILHPTSKQAVMSFIDVCCQDEKFVLAQDYWQKFIDNYQDKDYAVYQQYAEQVEKHNPKQAFWCWLNIYRQFPYNLQAKSKVQTLAISLGLSKKVEIKFDEQQRQQQLQQISTLFTEGKIAFDKKDYQTSNEIWQKAVDLAFDKADIPANLYLGLGKSYIRSGELQQAEHLVKQAMDIYPTDYHIAYLYPYILGKKPNHLPQKIVALKSLLSKFPQNFQLKLELAKDFIEMNEFTEADNCYHEYLQIDATNKEVLLDYARLAMRYQDWQTAISRWETVVVLYPNIHNGYLGLSMCYRHQNNYQQAQAIVVKGLNIADLQNNLPLFGEMLLISEKVEDFTQIMPIVDKVDIDSLSTELQIKLSNLLLKMNHIARSREVFETKILVNCDTFETLKVYPTQAENLKNWQEALYRWQYVGERIPKCIDVGLKIADVYKEMSNYQQSSQMLLSLQQQYGDNAEIGLRFARLSLRQGNRTQAIKDYERTLNKFPKNGSAVIGLITQLLADNQYQYAVDIYDKYAKNSSDYNLVTMGVNIHFSRFGNDATIQYIDELMAKRYPNDRKLHFRKIGCQLLSGYIENAYHAIADLEKMYKNNDQDYAVKTLLASAYIRVGQATEAQEIIKTIRFNEQDKGALKLYGWYYNMLGEVDKAKLAWQQLNNIAPYGPLKNKFDELSYISGDLTIKDTDILLFTCAHNEMLRLPFFIDYYRNLGVTKFFIIDNHSDDNIQDYMKQQADVCLFWTAHSFAKASHGMNWINGLIQEYGQNNWCIFVDADEFLIYPDIEHKKLPKLLKYFDTKGYEALFSFMLDMYPQDIKSQLSIKNDDNLIEKAPFFCNDYTFFQKTTCPYIDTRGGIFNRMTTLISPRTKTPIIKGGRGIGYVNNHEILPAKVAPLTSTLLHFKFIGDFIAKAQEQVDRKEHVGGGAGYQKYIDFFAEVGDDFLFTNIKDTTKFENSQQLVDLALIKTEDDWINYE